MTRLPKTAAIAALTAACLAAGCAVTQPRAPTGSFERGTQRLWFDVDERRSIHLADHPPLVGQLDLAPILDAESVDVDRVQVIAHQDCYYVVAKGFRSVWQVTPDPGTGRATYRPIGVAGAPSGDIRLARYGPAGHPSVRLDSDDGESWFLSDTPISVNGTVDEDPQALVEQAEVALDRGEANEAAALCRRARELIDSDPYWDPDGSYRDRLLPRLEERIARVHSATAKLEALRDQLSQPHRVPDSDDVAASIDSVNALAERSRAEVERIVAALPPGPERGALLQSARHAEVVGLADQRILDTVESLHSQVVRLSDDDERVRALTARLGALKRQLVDSSVEQEQLERQIAASEERHEALRLALVDFIGADPDAPADLDRALSYNIVQVWRTARSVQSQTAADLAQMLDRVERLRIANAGNVAIGSRNLVGRIDALQAAVDDVPVVDDPRRRSSGRPDSR